MTRGTRRSVFGALELEGIVDAFSHVREAVHEIAALDSAKLSLCREMLAKKSSLESLFSSQTFGVAVLDSDLRFLEVNEKLASMLETSVRDVVGTKMDSVFCNACARACADGVIAQTIKVRDGIKQESVKTVCFLTSGGDKRPANVYIKRFDCDDETKILVAVEPSTEALEELVTDVPSLETFSGTTDVAVVVTDPALHDNPIVWVNDTFCRVTGYSREDVVGKNPRFLRDEIGNSPETIDSLKSAVREGRDWNGVIRNKKRDGSYYYSHLTVEPKKDESGKIVQWYGFSADVTPQVSAIEDFRAIASSLRPADYASASISVELDEKGL